MLKLQIRKIVIQIEETCLEIGREVSPPSRKVTVAAVITNPYAGQYVEDLSPLYALGAEIGGGTPAEFANFIQSEIARYAEIVKRSGAKFE